MGGGGSFSVGGPGKGMLSRLCKCIYQMLLSMGYYYKLEMLGNACPYLHGHTIV